MIKYSPYGCSAVARCHPGLLLLSGSLVSAAQHSRKDT